jgi:hypothetical protein
MEVQSSSETSAPSDMSTRLHYPEDQHRRSHSVLLTSVQIKLRFKVRRWDGKYFPRLAVITTRTKGSIPLVRALGNHKKMALICEKLGTSKRLESEQSHSTRVLVNGEAESEAMQTRLCVNGPAEGKLYENTSCKVQTHSPLPPTPHTLHPLIPSQSRKWNRTKHKTVIYVIRGLIQWCLRWTKNGLCLLCSLILEILRDLLPASLCLYTMISLLGTASLFIILHCIKCWSC